MNQTVIPVSRQLLEEVIDNIVHELLYEAHRDTDIKHAEEDNEEDEPLRKNSPDQVTINGRSYDYNDSSAYCFSYAPTSHEMVVATEGGQQHNEMYAKQNQGISQTFWTDLTSHKVVKGRYWADINVLSIWEDVENIHLLHTVVNILQEKFHFDTSTLLLNISNDKIIPYSSTVSSSDITSSEAEKKASQRAYNVHLMSGDEKRKIPELKASLENNSDKIGQKLYNPRTGKEMPLAQYRALKSTSENKTYR